MAQVELTDEEVFGNAPAPPGMFNDLVPPQNAPQFGAVIDARNGAPLNDAQTAAYHRLLASGALNPKAEPGTQAFPIHQANPSDVPPAGRWYVDLGGNVLQSTGSQPAASPPSPASTSQERGLTDEEVFGPNVTFDDLIPKKPVSQALGFSEGVHSVGNNLLKMFDGSASPWAMPAGDPRSVVSSVLSAPVRHLLAKYGDANVQAEKKYEPGQFGRFAGTVAASLPLGVDGAPALSGLLQGYVSSESADPVQRLLDMGGGALGGKVLSKLGGAIKSTIAPQLSPALRTLADAGVPLTPGQIAGGTVKRLEDAATSIPILGDLIRNAQARSFVGLNRAAANRALTPIGESLPSSVNSGREAVTYAGDKLSQGYEDLLPNLTIRTDPEFHDGIRQLGAMAAELPESKSRQFGRFVAQHVIDKFGPDQTMSGQSMKEAEQMLGHEIAEYRNSPLPDDRKYAGAIDQVRQQLRDLVARGNPQAAERLANLNKGWANLAIVENAASRLGADEGLFTPSQLAAAVRAGSDTVRKRGYARGEALMQDLSDAARATLPSSVPDSGSPLRHGLEAGVGIGVAKESGLLKPLIKGAVVGAGVGLPYTRIGQDVLNAAIRAPRSEGAESIAALLQRLRPGLATGGATAGSTMIPPNAVSALMPASALSSRP